MKPYKININGKTYSVEIKEMTSDKGTVNVNGTDYEVEIPAEHAPVSITRPKSTAVPQAEEPAATAPATGAVTSPLPGTILSISVSKGQSVRRGERLVVLEAMKMENDILAAQDGTITQILVDKGDTVQEGQTLIIIG